MIFHNIKLNKYIFLSFFLIYSLSKALTTMAISPLCKFYSFEGLFRLKKCKRLNTWVVGHPSDC